MDPLVEIARSRLGRVLRSKWKLEEVLGVGGMATVYRAVHRNGAAVAIKMLHPELTLDRGLCERFLREGYMANRVGHDGAVKVLDDDVDEVDGAAFLVMELLEGETVEHRWKRKGERLPTSEVVSIAYHAADVLVNAHEQGIIHRDIKPENLFLTRGGLLKILDFGVARLRELAHSDPHATQQGAALGTPAFMPPEQARGRWNLVDGRSDVWSLGATMFTLLSGRWVHECETAAEQVIAAATEPAPTLSQMAPEVAPAVGAIVDRALRYEMSERFQDMAAMRLALQEAAAGPLSDRPRLPKSTVFAAVSADRGAELDGAEPISGRGVELIEPSSEDEPATRVLGAAELLASSEALRLPSLDSRPDAAAAAAPHPRVTTAAALSSTRRPRRHTNRGAVALGIGIAIAGILVALVLVALRTNYVPGLMQAAQPPPPPSSSAWSDHRQAEPAPTDESPQAK